MPKKRAKPKPPAGKPAKPKLVPKTTNFPADWIEAIDKARGKQSFGDFVRDAVRARIDAGDLSEVPAWGQGRPRKDA